MEADKFLEQLAEQQERYFEASYLRPRPTQVLKYKSALPATQQAPTADVEALTAALFRVLNEEEIWRRAELPGSPHEHRHGSGAGLCVQCGLTRGEVKCRDEQFERTASKMRSLRLDLDAQARNMAGKVFDYLQRGEK